ncbi:hypothetical protein F0U62_18675 [Cystobacter fuscus]|uniref:hypothetical protein n=1 Tax=Cystobacter fuscus TaxID=43 RepID=UPI002B2EF6EE|nr:hypothetical protein F0U62_18675 [Cystobacter fuscus]
MADLPELMARLRVASVTGSLSPDLARELLLELSSRADRAERRELRDERLRAAGALLPGSPYERSRELAARVARLGALHHAAPGGADMVRSLVLEALEIDPETPRGWRQLLRIIDEE